jgi:hypothetical protein
VPLPDQRVRRHRLVRRQGQGSWGYGNQPKTIDELYTRYAGLVNALLDNPRLFGFCYTQLTDVEQEKNGLCTFDRRAKFDAERMRAITSRAAAYESTPPLEIPRSAVAWRVLVGAQPDGALARPWRYCVAKPATEWAQPTFDDSSWASGLAASARRRDGRVAPAPRGTARISGYASRSLTTAHPSSRRSS